MAGTQSDPSMSGDSSSSSSFSRSGGPSSVLQHVWGPPNVEGNPPVAREGHSADVIGGNQIFIFGGWDGQASRNDLHILDTDKMAWRQVVLAGAPYARCNHATAVSGLSLYVHGGSNKISNGDQYWCYTYKLDTLTLRWTEWATADRTPGPRACHTLNEVDQKLYLFGGWNKREYLNSIDIFDLATQSWTQPPIISGVIPQARKSHTMTVLNESLILFGGCDGSNYFNDVHLFNTATLTWSQPEMFGDPPASLCCHSATLIDDRLFIFGGWDGLACSNSLYILEKATFKWFESQKVEWTPSGRYCHSSSLVGSSKLFVFGGFDGTKRLNDLRVMHVSDVSKLPESIRNGLCNLKTLIGDPQFSDVTLVVDGHDIPAHRSILAAQCGYFRTMFSSPMKESQEERISIYGWTYEAYKAMLEFLYTGYLYEEQDSVICDVMGLADQYGLDQLKAVCEDSLKNSVNSENVCSILKHADKYQAANLKKFCHNYIFQHGEEVAETEGLESFLRWPELLLDIVKLALRGAGKRT